ncbi:MAG: hypothetical protein HKN29_11530 [Rhodothermales bacterium]|nr:hypothetical protein [Rhodothermales bacterium]
MRRTGKSSPPFHWHALLLVLLAGGCDVNGSLLPEESFRPIVEVAGFRSTVAGIVYDVEDGRVLEDVELRFLGEGGLLIRDFLDRPVSGPALVGKSASFGLANTARPAPDRPVELVVLAHKPGYRASSTRLEFRGPGPHEFRIGLLPESGVSGEIHDAATATVTNGRLADALVLTPTLAGAEVLSVALPAASKMDAGPAPINGLITLEASWSAPSQESLLQLPGGTDALFSGGEGLLPGGTDTGSANGEGLLPGTMVLGSIVRVFSPGHEGLVFGDSADVMALVSPVLSSPRTNAPVVAGVDIDVFAWQPERGTWRLEDRVPVVPVAGGLGARFRIRSTGLFGVGYRTVPCADATLRLSGNDAGGVVVAHRGQSGRADGIRVWRFRAGEETVTLSSPPSFWRGQLEVVHDEERAVVSFGDLCGGAWDVDLTRRGAGEPTPHRLVAESCDALILNDVPTANLLVVPDASLGKRALQAPYIVEHLTRSRDSAGRLLGFEGVSPGTRGQLVLAVDRQAWTYDLPGETIDISAMAIESGLCL